MIKVLDFRGVFYEHNSDFWVADEIEGNRNVTSELRTFANQKVRLIAHHLPQQPHDHSRWGGGCCMLENTGFCHFGHHVQRNNLYTFDGVGVFRTDWHLDGYDYVCRPSFLVGHRSQVLISRLLDLEDLGSKIKSFDPSNLEGASMDELEERLKSLRDFMVEIGG